MTFVDLTQPMEPGMPAWPGDPPFRRERALVLERDGCNVLAVHLGSHTGTHVDAPFHVRADGARLDELAWELLTGPAVAVDVRGAAPGEALGWDRLAAHADRFTPGAVVLLHTGWSRHWGSARYGGSPWLTAAAAARLVAAGVRTLGVDCASPDPPGRLDVHSAVLGAGGVLVENLTGLDRLARLVDPHVGFFPMPLAGADGAPVRAVAWSGAPPPGR